MDFIVGQSWVRRLRPRTDGKEVKRDDSGSDRQEVSFVVWVQPQVCPSRPIGKLDKVCTGISLPFLLLSKRLSPTSSVLCACRGKNILCTSVLGTFKLISCHVTLPH